MNEIAQETSALAQVHAQVTSLIATFETNKPNWSSPCFVDLPDAESRCCAAEDAWETHFTVLEHLYTATAPHTPRIVRLTLFSAALNFAGDVEGELEPQLKEAGAVIIALAQQLNNIPIVI